jgi:hypothetical protein
VTSAACAQEAEYTPRVTHAQRSAARNRFMVRVRWMTPLGSRKKGPDSEEARARGK